MSSPTIFAALGYEVIPRILGLGDRRRGSETYGCFDRSYWHYRLSDFPSAWFQSAGHLLALAYTVDWAGSPYRGNARVREWGLAAARFLVRTMHRDGSVDEIFPNERSYCATAFGAYHLTECLLYLHEELPPGGPRMAEWLMRRRSDRVANQNAAAAMALCNFGTLTGRREFTEAGDRRLAELCRDQDPAGFFAEYGGYDVGYLTVTLSLLAKRASRAGSDRDRGHVAAALDFLDRRIQPEGSFSIEGTTRRTQFLYPSGFAFYRHPALERITKGLTEGRVLRPAWFDDRYVIPITIDYLEAFMALSCC